LNRAGFSISNAAVSDGLRLTQISCRLQRVDLGPGEPFVILDVAHNPDAAAEIAAEIPRAFDYRRLGLIVGMTRGHSLEGFLSHLAPIADQVFATRAQWEKSVPAEETAAAASLVSHKVRCCESVAEAVRAAFEWAQPGDALLAAGSFFIVDEVIRALGPERVPIA
jgi:dihydrofolate synthase/folylpolyglutamate synthase